MTEPAPIGNNNPPNEDQVFAENMTEKYRDILKRAEELQAARDRAPKEVNDDETSGKIGDYVKQLKGSIKSLEAARKSEKDFFLRAGQRVDGFFNVKYIDKLKKVVDELSALTAAYLKRKEDEERQKREEEAERLRQEAAEKLRLAQEAEAEAKRKQEEAEAEQRRIKEEAEAKERKIREEAEAKLRELQAKIDALEAEKAQPTADAAEIKSAIRETKEALKEVDKEAKAELKEVKADVKAAEAEVKAISAEAKGELRDSKRLLDTAVRTDKQADKMEKLAGASAADLARTRGEHGSLSTMKTEWVGTVIDRNIIPASILFPHFKDDDIQIALNSWVKANPGKMLPGCFIREETTAIIR